MRKTKKQRKEEKRIRIRNRKLVKLYPFLRPVNVWTGKPDKNYDYSYTMLMDGGWFQLQTDLCRELRPLLLKVNYLYKYQLVQVKSKYGSLRWYSNGYPTSISNECYEIERKYEDIAEKTCCKCGKPAKMCIIGGWFDPYCEKCMKKIHNNYNRYRKEPVEFNYEDYVAR